MDFAAATAGLDELAVGGDPLECQACLALGGECEFHRGWAAGWDACTAFVARFVEQQHAEARNEGGGRLWVADVARLLGVSRPRAWQLRKRADFPAPAGREGGRDWWHEHDIRRWATTARVPVDGGAGDGAGAGG